MTRILRCLWGDLGEGCRLNKVWTRDVKGALRRGEADRFECAVYGEENYHRLTELGVRCELLDPLPFPDGARDTKTEKTTIRPWWYKHEMIAKMAELGPLIYCDWDVKIKVERIDFETRAKLMRHDFLLSLYKYKNPRSQALPRSKKGRRLSVSGNWIFTKDDVFPKAILTQMGDSAPDAPSCWHDEYAMNDYIDSLHGGWPGREEWLRLYESPYMIQQPSRCPWEERSKTKRIIQRATPIPFTWRRLFSQ